MDCTTHYPRGEAKLKKKIKKKEEEEIRQKNLKHLWTNFEFFTYTCKKDMKLSFENRIPVQEHRKTNLHTRKKSQVQGNEGM